MADRDMMGAEKPLSEALRPGAIQVIRSYSWAAAESPKNSQCKPVNNCGGSRDFPETLVSSLERWQPAAPQSAGYSNQGRTQAGIDS
jgi:hypothetical protein